jgi:hypothetical protein
VLIIDLGTTLDESLRYLLCTTLRNYRVTENAESQYATRQQIPLSKLSPHAHDDLDHV